MVLTHLAVISKRDPDPFDFFSSFLDRLEQVVHIFSFRRPHLFSSGNHQTSTVLGPKIGTFVKINVFTQNVKNVLQ